MNRLLKTGKLACMFYLCCLPAQLFAEYRYPVGERATYTIKWGVLACGTSTIACDEVELDGKTFIRIRIRAKSNWLVSSIYPVNDTVDCFIDPETRLSVRLEKNTSEGGFACKDILLLDRQNNTAQWNSQSQNISTNYPIEPGSCDAISFLYLLRRLDFKPGESREFNMAVDGTLHQLTITARNTARKKVGDSRKILCRSFVATPKRDDLFVRKIPREIWITEDNQRILAKMVLKVPVGNVRIILDKYSPPTGN